MAGNNKEKHKKYKIPPKNNVLLIEAPGERFSKIDNKN
jgi:hypothetical protein